MASTWIDVSVPLRTGMVNWPGDPPVRISRALDMERGDKSTVSLLEMGSHTGTHMDAPAHFVRGGIGIDGMPLGRSHRSGEGNPYPRPGVRQARRADATCHPARRAGPVQDP